MKLTDEIEIVKATTSFDEYVKAQNLYDQVAKVEHELPVQLTLLYKLGFIEGKRQERARRKAGVLA